jgi:hypothetical protein
MNSLSKYILMLCGLLLAGAAQAQLVNTNFGQSRVLYERENWFRYEAEHFAILFPKELEPLAAFVVEQAEADYGQLKTTLEYQIRNKIEIILYSDYSSYLQNNIGVYDKTMNTGGTTRMFSHKILLHMYMTRHDLRYQLRQGIARALVNRMLYGSNLQEVVQNSVAQPLQKWFSEGMISYAASDWDVVADDELREVFLGGKYANFYELEKKKPALAGRSMFHFISQRYGTASVGNLFYLTRINRSVESGFLYVFGSSYPAMCANWFNFYKERYNADNQDRRIPSKGELTLKTHKNATVAELCLSPDGKKTAYVEIHKGQYFIWLHDVATDKAEVIFKGGLRDLSEQVPLNYPRLSFDQENKGLFFSTHEKHKIKIQQYRLADKNLSQPKTIEDIDFINHIDAWRGEEVIASALKNGQSDIYRISLKTGKAEPITTDIYDDFMPSVVRLGGKTGIVFSSIRPEPKLGNPKPDAKPATNLFAKLYFYELSSRSREIVQLSNFAVSTDFMATAVDDTTIAFLSDANGITNRYICRLDTVVLYYNRNIVLKDGQNIILHADSSYAQIDSSTIDSQFLTPVTLVKGKSYANSDYSRSLLGHQTATQAAKVADLLYYNSQYRIFIRDLSPAREESPKSTTYSSILGTLWGTTPKLSDLPKSKSIVNPTPEPKKEAPRTPEEELKIVSAEIANDSTPKRDTSKIDIDNYLFQSEFKDIKNPISKNDSLRRDPNFRRDSIPPQPTILVEDENGVIRRQEPSTRPNNNLLKPTANSTVLQYKYDPSRKTAYRSLFRADAISLQFDNTPLFGGLDMYLGGFYRFTPLSFGLKTNFTDIHENYRLEIGLRLPVAFNGFDAYFIFDDRKGKIDKKYSFYRRTRTEDYNLIDTTTNNIQVATGRNIKHLAQVEFKYPLNRYQSLRALVGVQHDQVAITAREVNSLSVPRYIENRTWLRFEYVFDNCVELRQNTRKGMKFKAFFDYFQPLNVRTDSSFRVDFSGGNTGNIGIDWRYYLSPDNKTVFAFRTAAAASFGPQKILYSLGGIENWVFASTDQLIPLPAQEKFAYQTLAAPIRGFSNNIRNGSNFVAMTAEARIPIAEYIDFKNTRSNIVRTLQFVPFFDIGTAWQGLSPFSTTNPLNTSLIDRSSAGSVSPIRVRVNYFRQPIVYGFGAGLRAAVSGYFLRLDLGFGVETGVMRSPTLQLGIGTDF